MGYQESLLYLKKEYQDDFIKKLEKYYKEEWNSLAEPTYIINLKKYMLVELYDNKVLKLKPGDKIIYITGERSHQRDLKSFLMDKYKFFKNIKEEDYKIIPSEECMEFCSYIFEFNEKLRKDNKVFSMKMLYRDDDS